KTVKQFSQKEFDKRGMNVTVDQWVLLKIIHERAPISQVELAKFSMRDPASITRTLDILNKKKLIFRQQTPGSRRQFDVSLTKIGEDFVKAHMSFVQGQRNRSVEGLSESDQAKLMNMLLQIQENMS
ncbi:MAG: MarR family transcriptional regulator, partial [Bacteroidota bacterium]